MHILCCLYQDRTREPKPGMIQTQDGILGIKPQASHDRFRHYSIETEQKTGLHHPLGTC